MCNPEGTQGIFRATDIGKGLRSFPNKETNQWCVAPIAKIGVSVLANRTGKKGNWS
jgi:hypothetical protein